jgi:hypothetical protein
MQNLVLFQREPPLPPFLHMQRTTVSKYVAHVLTSLRLRSNIFKMFYLNCINNP